MEYPDFKQKVKNIVIILKDKCIDNLMIVPDEGGLEIKLKDLLEQYEGEKIDYFLAVLTTGIISLSPYLLNLNMTDVIEDDDFMKLIYDSVLSFIDISIYKDANLVKNSIDEKDDITLH